MSPLDLLSFPLTSREYFENKIILVFLFGYSKIFCFYVGIGGRLVDCKIEIVLQFFMSLLWPEDVCVYLKIFFFIH